MSKKTTNTSNEFNRDRELMVMLEGMRDEIRTVAEGQKAIPAIKEKVDIMWEEMGRQREDILIIKAVVLGHGGRLDRIESDVSVLKSDMVEVKEGLGRLETDVSEIKDTVKGHDKWLAKL